MWHRVGVVEGLQDVCVGWGGGGGWGAADTGGKVRVRGEGLLVGR